MINVLDENINKIKGIGPKTVEILNSLKIYTIKDILFNIPTRIKYSNELNLEIKNGEKVITTATVIGNLITQYYGRKSRSYFTVITNIGTVKIIFFNQIYLKKIIKEGNKLTIKGIYNSSNNTITASNITTNKEEHNNKVEVVYSLKNGLTTKKYLKIVQLAFSMIEDYNFVDIVPKDFKGIWDIKKIIQNLHFPKNNKTFDKAKKMFAFHELLHYQLKIKLQSLTQKNIDINYSIDIQDNYIEDFKKTLIFKLTKSQSDVIDQILKDLRKPFRMDRLLQGDVGCGKTVVAAALIYSVIKSGCQTAIMAPTEILSKQHFKTFFNFFKHLDISIALLTSSTSKKERDKILSLLKNGEIDLLIGTHALIQEDVIFNNLRFIVTDEQHRFGVNQRKNLSEKGINVHTLMMTATPIPRSLAITLITDIKISTINELPQGRKKVETYKVTNKQIKNALENVVKELDKGRQGYIVCPLIEGSEKLDLENVNELYDKVKNFIPSKYNIEILHGKMNQKEKDFIMDKYLKNEIQVLISTTVIEVGVNVSNATFMMIIDAHRFGLATLHQLRGRVGRSKFQSYCILVSDSKNERIDIMCLENDGFKISEYDLKNRGPGDIFGIKQSGLPTFKAADLMNDTDLMFLAKKLAEKLVEGTDKEKLINYLGMNNIFY